MLNYEEIKKKFQDKDNKKTLLLGVCFLLVFVMGIGVGKYDKQSAQLRNKTGKSTQNNYNTNNTANTNKNQAEPQVAGQVVQEVQTAAGQPVSASSTAKCLIKGNISSTGGKIYHMPGGAFYDRTNPEQCFNTENEARTAGYRKSSR